MSQSLRQCRPSSPGAGKSRAPDRGSHARPVRDSLVATWHVSAGRERCREMETAVTARQDPDVVCYQKRLRQSCCRIQLAESCPYRSAEPPFYALRTKEWLGLLQVG